jgi:ABC-type amino acid transport substrate-binding protein
MLEVIRAMEQVIGKKMPEKFMEWPTAQKLVRDGRDGMIFPFTRNAAREANYAWVLKFWDIQEAFYVKPGETAPASYEAAAKLPSVGVVGGSSQDSMLTSKNLTNLQRFENVPALAAGVAAGKVTAGYGPLIEVKYAWLQQKLPGKPSFGTVVSVAAQWIAISKDSPDITPADWQQAFDVVQQDGTFDKLYTQYFGAKEE